MTTGQWPSAKSMPVLVTSVLGLKISLVAFMKRSRLWVRNLLTSWRPARWTDHFSHLPESDIEEHDGQESIPVGCVPPAFSDLVEVILQRFPLDMDTPGQEWLLGSATSSECRSLRSTSRSVWSRFASITCISGSFLLFTRGIRCLFTRTEHY